MKNNASNGVMIIAGLLDPCGDIGTQGRFSLLPIPWKAQEFEEQVTRAVRYDFWQQKIVQDQSSVFPITESEVEALARGVGLRLWIQIGQSHRSLLKLLTPGWSDRTMAAAEKEVDRLSFHVESFDYHWPVAEADDKEALHNLEVALSRAHSINRVC